jgi:TolB-like protein/tetratricopeptide (TPR) repeat protein
VLATGTPVSPHAAAQPDWDSRRLSLVVLPFENIGNDPDQEYFVDGVTDSLTTDLSRMRGMLVIGRNTAFTYKAKHIDLKQIGHELGVRYVLEGSVQRAGNRMRVNTQLIDATTGIHLWAERFDKPLADLFEMQDEIVTRIERQLGTQLITAEARRANRSANPDSLDMYFQGMSWVYKGSNAECLSEARRYFERALTVDPGNVQAIVMRAYADLGADPFIQAKDRAVRLAATEATLTNVLSLDPEHAFAHACLGLLQILTNRAVAGIAECERALALARNLVTAHALIGLAKMHIGRCEETDAHIQEAIRLSPRDSFAYSWMSIAGYAKLLLGSDEEAVSLYRRSIELNRNEPFAHFHLAAALAHLGQLAESHAALQAGLAIRPGLTIRHYKARSLSDNPTYLLQRERVIEGLRKAGVPEG